MITELCCENCCPLMENVFTTNFCNTESQFRNYLILLKPYQGDRSFFVYCPLFHRTPSPDIPLSNSWNCSREKLQIFLPSEAATYLLGNNSEIKGNARKLEVFGKDPL